jgi:segregation and condensation protein B
MEITNLIPHIEALVFASDKPLTSLDITELLNNAFGFMEDKISLDQVESSIEGISEKYSSEFYPFELRQSGGGWQFLTKKDYHKTIAQLNGDKFLKRLSSAALETLSIVAYKQPVTKGEIESIRGVSSDYAVQKLLEKELIIISGRNEKLPGHPLVYSTSKNFMDYFGINSAEDLPKIKEVLADQVVEPTIIKDAEISEEGNNEGTEDQASHSLTEEEIKAEGTEDETMLSVTEEEAKAERTEEETMLSVTEEEAKAEGVDNDAMLSVTEDGELVDKVEGEDQD